MSDTDSDDGEYVERVSAAPLTMATPVVTTPTPASLDITLPLPPPAHAITTTATPASTTSTSEGITTTTSEGRDDVNNDNPPPPPLPLPLDEKKTMKSLMKHLHSSKSLDDMYRRMRHQLDKACATNAALDKKQEERKRPRLPADEDRQSVMTILRNCTNDEERKVKIEMMLGEYHALIDIPSLSDLFDTRPSSTSPSSSSNRIIGKGKSDDRASPVVRSEEKRELLVDGWPVLVRPNSNFDINDPTTFAMRVAVQGNYNKGKTFLFNLLAGVKLRDGYTHHTRGISMHLVPVSATGPAMVLLDSAGSNTGVIWNEANVQNKESTDAFLRDLLHRVADVKLTVTGRLTRDDQQYLRAFIRKLEEGQRANSSQAPQRPFLVHNFQELSTVEEVEEVIQSELIGLFGATEQLASMTRKWYESIAFDHYVLARAGTPAGDHYNPIAVSLLREKLVRKTLPVNMVLTKIREVAQDLLNQYLIEDNGDTLVQSTIVRKIILAGDTRVYDTREVKYEGKLELEEQMQDGGMYRRFVLNATNANGKRPALMLSPYIGTGKYGSVFVNDKAFEPRIDVQCTANGSRVVVKLDIPGGSVMMKKDGQVLRFTGERKRDLTTVQLKGQQFVERLYGSFDYSVTLPHTWGCVRVHQRKANGVYQVDLCLPKNINNVMKQIEADVCAQVKDQLRMDEEAKIAEAADDCADNDDDDDSKSSPVSPLPQPSISSATASTAVAAPIIMTPIVFTPPPTQPLVSTMTATSPLPPLVIPSLLATATTATAAAAESSPPSPPSIIVSAAVTTTSSRSSTTTKMLLFTTLMMVIGVVLGTDQSSIDSVRRSYPNLLPTLATLAVSVLMLVFCRIVSYLFGY